MSDPAKTGELVQVTSVAALLDNNMRITWTGFRPSTAEDKNPTIYFTTLPGNGQVTMTQLGVRNPDFEVGITLLSGTATLNGQPLKVGAQVDVPKSGSGDPFILECLSPTVSLQAVPKRESSGGESMARSGGDGSGDPPPPPYPGGNHNN